MQRCFIRSGSKQLSLLRKKYMQGAFYLVLTISPIQYGSHITKRAFLLMNWKRLIAKKKRFLNKTQYNIP